MIIDNIHFPTFDILNIENPHSEQTKYIYFCDTNNIFNFVNGKIYNFWWDSLGEYFYTGLVTKNEKGEVVPLSEKFIDVDKYHLLPFKVGDRVYHHQHGWGYVKRISTFYRKDVLSMDDYTKYSIKFDKTRFDDWLSMKYLSHCEYDLFSNNIQYWKDGNDNHKDLLELIKQTFWIKQ